MDLHVPKRLIAAVFACMMAMPLAAETPRDMLMEASFQDADKASVMRKVSAAHDAATRRLRHDAGDREAALMQATALGYQAKLTGSRAGAIAARKAMERLVAVAPGDAERHLALGAWHMGAVHKLGGMIARAALGGSRKAGLSCLDRAVALGGDRARYPGLAALLRLQLDPEDARGRQLAEAAVRAAAPSAMDRHLQRAASAILAPLRAGDGAAVRRLAARLLPMGKLGE
jgi:hypothetical protein